MDGTIDSLNIELRATTSSARLSINDLINSLERLDAKLGSIKNLESFRRNLDGLDVSMESLGATIGKMDVSKFKDIANAFNSISRSSGRLSSAISSLSFTKVRDEAKGFTRVITETSRTLASEFGIRDKAVIRDLENQLTELAKETNSVMNQGGSGSRLESIYSKMTQTLWNNRRTVQGIGTEYDNLVQKINKANVAIDFQKSEFGDMYSKMRNTLGKGWAKDNASAGAQGLDVWVESLSPTDIDLMQRYGYVVGDTTSAFRALYEVKQRWLEVNRSGAAVENEVNSSMRGTQAAVQSTIESFANLSAQIGNVSTIGQTQVVDTFQTMANGIKQFESVNIKSVDQIKTLSSAIASLGRTGTERAITNIPLLAKVFKEMMGTLSTAPVVSQNVIDVANSLAALANNSRGAISSMNKIVPSFNRFGSSARRASHNVRGLAGQFGKFYATFWLLIRAFRKLGEAIDLSSQLTEVENVVNQTFGNLRGILDSMTTNSINKFGMSELAVKKFASRFQAMGAALGITSKQVVDATSQLTFLPDEYGKIGNSIADMSTNLTRLTADMASFYDVAQADVAEDLEAIFTGMTRPLRKYGIDLTQATLKEWALNRGMNANLETMTQAEKTMLRYMYVMERAQYAMGDFERTSDTWHNQINILKANLQQLAIVIGQGFINALKPLVRGLNAALTSITSFAVKVLNALGQIFGWKYELNLGGVTNDLEDGAEYADDLSDGLGGAAKNAEKLKNNLLGIDELNIISPEDNSGKGGSGGGAASGGGGFDNSDIIRAVKTGEGLMKSSIDNLYKLGSYIGDTMANTLKDIDWDHVYQGAKDFGRGLASFLNGLINTDLFAEVGKTIANSLNTAITAALAFGSTLNWYSLGYSIAEGINEFFKNFDVKQLAETINVWVQGLWHMVKTAIDNIDWSTIWKDVKDFMSEIDLETVTIIVGYIGFKYLGKLLTSGVLAKLFVTKMFGESGIMTVALEGLKIKILDIAAASLSGVPIGEAIAAAFGGTALTLAGVIGVSIALVLIEIKALKWADEKGYLDKIDKMFRDFRDKVKKKFRDAFGARSTAMGFDGEEMDLFTPFSELVKSRGFGGAIWETFFNFDEAKEYFAKAKFDFIGGNIVDGIKEGMSGAIVGLFEPIHDLFWFVIDGFCNLFGIHSPADETKPIGKNIILGIAEGFNLVNFGEVLSNWWNTNVVPWFTLSKWESIGENVRKSLTDKFEETRKSISEKWDGVKSKLEEIPFVQSLSDSFSTLRENLSTKISEIRTNVDTQWDGVKTKLAETPFVQNLRDSFVTLRENVSTRLAETRTNVTLRWNEVKSKLAETPFVQALKNSFDTLRNNVTSSVSTMKTNVHTKWDEIKNKLAEQPFVSTVLNNFASMRDRISESMRSMWDSVRDYWDRIKDKLSNAVNGYININTTQSSGSRRADGGVFVNGHWRDIAAYADGGLPTTGQMFIAREAGPELVGSLGGHTAVMNNDQIVSSVAYGVQQAVATVLTPYLASIARTNEIIADKDMSVSIGDREIAEANRRGSRGLGAQLRTN